MFICCPRRPRSLLPPRSRLESRMLIPTLQIVNPKGEMKGSAITGPVGKEAAELWPVSFSRHKRRSPFTP